MCVVHTADSAVLGPTPVVYDICSPMAVIVLNIYNIIHV